MVTSGYTCIHQKLRLVHYTGRIQSYVRYLTLTITNPLIIISLVHYKLYGETHSSHCPIFLKTFDGTHGVGDLIVLSRH